MDPTILRGTKQTGVVHAPKRLGVYTVSPWTGKSGTWGVGVIKMINKNLGELHKKSVALRYQATRLPDDGF